ncbi:LysR family transcriptional regulator [Mycobacterium sp. 1423905.2]|uniref:LysR family transcriptional regulator n=1 Tax=Mycobacterium sp. 1423905.2 TaxID=1856859 RepID=UPI0008020F61|nr:LysR family transcriptional regulator [Mycobacterium sp. 1423905.2]OBJ54803.1 LysR family transcriptional regulator [Mycobacterium sp. 1423905.2]
MELRQLRYFVAVAEELHFGRAAKRVHISGPALSQQILALERELGTDLFIRDRRSVRLNQAGRTLLADARRLLALADDAKNRVMRTAAASTPLRLGYVSWLPDELKAAVGPSVELRIDEWVLPSHAQADRVAEGTLDIALTWVTAAQAGDRGLIAHLLRAEALRAVLPGIGSTEPIAAQRLSVLIDADESAWSSWNRFATEFAAHAKARVVHIDDGGITGDAFYAHVRRLGSAVLASPKRHTAPSPPSLGQRPITEPLPLWTWSLVHREDDDRPGVRQVVDSLLSLAGSRDWRVPPVPHWWIPADDPHRAVLSNNAGRRLEP